MHHILLNHSSIDGHVRCFHILDVGNDAAVNMSVQCLFEI